MAGRNLSADVWSMNVAGLVSLMSVAEDVPQYWRDICTKALADADDTILLGGVLAIGHLAANQGS